MKMSRLAVLLIVILFSGCQTSKSSIPSTQVNLTFENPTATVPLNKSELLDNILENKICDLPCFLNLEPGKTPTPDAIEALSQYGSFNFYKDDTIPEYNHHEFRFDFPEMEITVIGYLYSKNDTITNINYDIYSEDHTRLKNYTIENLLLRHGQPTLIWIAVGVQDSNFTPTETSFDLIFYYSEINTLAVFFGTAVLKDGHYVVCPEQPFGFSTQENPDKGITRIISGDPNYYQTPNSLVKPSGWEIGELSAERGIYFAPITMDTDETIDSLTNGIISEGNYCFKWFPKN